MVSAILPQEVVDIVIFCLSKDDKASRACALVCRSWVHPARCNIFRSIRIEFKDWKVTPFLDLLQSNPGLGSYIWETNWDLPVNPSWQCRIESELTVSLLLRLAALSNDHGTTHNITITMRRDHDQYVLSALDCAPSLASYIKRIRWGCEDGSTYWEESAAQSLASKLRSLKVLTLAQWGSFPFVPTLPFQAIGDLFRPTSITTLNVENLVFTDGSQFLHFVHAFTALRNLSCGNMEWMDNTANIFNKGSPRAPPLRYISLGGSPPAVFSGVVQWLLDQPVVPALKTIGASRNVPSEMNELVQRCASSIINLTCSGEGITV
jgi:hypothetical protein